MTSCISTQKRHAKLLDHMGASYELPAHLRRFAEADVAAPQGQDRPRRVRPWRRIGLALALLPAVLLALAAGTWALLRARPVVRVPAENRALVEEALHSEVYGALLEEDPRWAAHRDRTRAAARGPRGALRFAGARPRDAPDRWRTHGQGPHATSGLATDRAARWRPAPCGGNPPSRGPAVVD